MAPKSARRGVLILLNWTIGSDTIEAMLNLPVYKS